MTIAKRLKGFLEENKASYEVLTHPEVYTAQEVAASLHVPGKELAKVVVVKVGGRFILTVIPASYKLDLKKLKGVFGGEKAELATEAEFKDLFPDCEPGSMSPFGNLYNLETYVDKTLTEDEEIVFQAGTHMDTIKVRYKDFERLAKPKISDFAIHL